MTDVKRVGVRVRTRRHRRASAGAALVCICACLLAGLFEKPAQNARTARVIRTLPENFKFAREPSSLPAETDGKRTIYPYSVIPGGVRNRAELVKEVSSDPVVAAHYAGFNTAQARMVRTRDAKPVYVSYRVDNKVFWTAKTVRLPQGEELVTDGEELARARCGNRISANPRQPTLPVEPPSESFETPIVNEPQETVIPKLELNLPKLMESSGLPPLLEALPPPRAVPIDDGWLLPHIPAPYAPFFAGPGESMPTISGLPEQRTLLFFTPSSRFEIQFLAEPQKPTDLAEPPIVDTPPEIVIPELDLEFPTFMEILGLPPLPEPLPPPRTEPTDSGWFQPDLPPPYAPAVVIPVEQLPTIPDVPEPGTLLLLAPALAIPFLLRYFRLRNVSVGEHKGKSDSCDSDTEK